MSFFLKELQKESSSDALVLSSKTAALTSSQVIKNQHLLQTFKKLLLKATES